MREYWDTWGWYSLLRSVANSNLFNKSGLSNMAAAKGASFWEAFTWIAQDTHQDSFNS